ncbi:hypothetical protein IM793_23035 [Pedobacter sp. MR2016-19]|uniref:hypothetical protein n=1 Tax=Pedobacter sp. MR2016-19 TaxID=2780089 RepID=UPI0018752F6D|nr:hypothetical protein [Pedobacter sp. MR2016-19]MBE5322049.1 hypothetical protein [Pedobacter sp. MR2016-19]
MILSKEETWPTEIIDFLKNDGQPLLDYELNFNSNNYHFIGFEYDKAHRHLWQMMSKFTFEGVYHCTRLTAEEMFLIRAHGMQLPNQAVLNDRIDRVKESGLVSLELAESMKAKNEADDKYRKDMLHFVFQAPYFEGEHGIGRFFRSWGGEALYNCHEEDLQTGLALRKIGIPAIIEVRLKIGTIGGAYLINKISRIYLINRGHDIQEPIRHEDHTRSAIPKQDMIDIYCHPDQAFLTFSGCKSWVLPL